jgi:hypothetical protein
MLKVLSFALLILATLTTVVFGPIEARKVRDGRNVRSVFWLSHTKTVLDLPHEEFVAKYRRALRRMGWPNVVLGALMLTATAALVGLKADAAMPLVWGSFSLLTGLTSVRCRRIVDSRNMPETALA